MEMLKTNSALPISAFLKNTVNPNYEINICSISRFCDLKLYFLAVTYTKKKKTKKKT